MNALKANDRSSFLAFIFGMFPIALFVSILVIPIPISISAYFSRFSYSYFILVFVLYYISFRIKTKYPWFLAACVTALVFAMRLSYLWISGHSGSMVLAGLLPFKDGFHYYGGANFLANGQLITSVASWRPVFTSFVSSSLVITQHSLMWSMAIIVGVLALSCFLSAYLIRSDFGVLAGALYITFLYFYIQSLVGFLYTELLGLALGCLGFILVWNATKSQNIIKVALGLAVLMMAVSVRAGTFFVFPILILWAGWAFRKQSRFSFRSALIAFVAVSIAFLLVNTIFRSLIVEPGEQSFGNFSFTLYGQVVGGAGYNYAIQQFNTRNSEIIYRAAWKFFLQHPLSFFIGAAKAYRDFFFPNIGIFRFYAFGGHIVWSYLIWITGLGLTIAGVVKSVRKIFEPTYSFFVAVFIGFLLSIPFLPPIDGGTRIYASTMPLYFGFVAIAVGNFDSSQRPDAFESALLKLVGILSMLVISMAVIVPVFIQRLSTVPTFETPVCPPDQVPYVVELHRGSFVDILPDDEASCGHALTVCASDFQNSSVEMLADASDAEVYQVFLDGGITTGDGIRVFEGNDLVSETTYIFMGSLNTFQQTSNHNLIAGCGVENNIKKRPAIFQIDTVNVLD